MCLARVYGLIVSFLVVCCSGTSFLGAQQDFLRIDLKNALERARSNSQQLQSVTIDVNLAQENRSQARAALLPSLNYFNQFMYTQGNGTNSGVFIGSDGVHVYTSQAQVHQELFSPGKLAEHQRSVAAQSLATAKKDIVERGLVATVTSNFYIAVAAERKSVNSQHALDEARRFVEVTQKLEIGGEVAHADVLKAQLVMQQRGRELQDARLEFDKARIALAVLMFSDYRIDFELVDDLATLGFLPPYHEIEEAVYKGSPELRAAEENVRQEEFAAKVERSAYMPTLSFDYFFGINSNQFAVKDRDGVNRLGSAAQATLNIPIWNWGKTKSKVRQADMRRQQAQLELELSRRQLISNLHTLYLEAQAVREQIDLLQRSLEDATESLRLTNLRYEAGEISVLEVVDAQSTLTGARNSYDDGLARYRLALAGIQTLAGTM